MRPTAPPRRALIVAPSWVGDATMATPAFRAIKAAWPSTSLALLCRPGIDAVLAGLPMFDAVVVDGLRGALGPLRARRRLRDLGAEAAILFPNSFRAALTVFLARIPRRVGYARDGRSALLTDRVPSSAERPRSTVGHYCELVERGLGIEVSDRRLGLALTDADREGAARATAEIAGPYAVLVPGGNNPSKRWPPERFAAVADDLRTRRGLAVLVAGAPAEREVIDAIRAAARTTVTDLSSRGLGLGSLKAVIAGAALVVSNDTGPRHIAAAFDVPTVALFGPTDHRWTILPGARERLLVAEPFLPEELVADDRPAFCRIDRIAVEDVLAAAESLLAAPAVTAARPG